MVRFPTLLLDLDGTVANSSPGIIASYQAALIALGHGSEIAVDHTAIIGPPVHEVIAMLLGQYQDKRISEGVEAHWKHYAEVGMFQTLLYRGWPKLLRDLQRGGCRVYIATAKRTNIAIDIARRLSILSYLNGVYGCEPDGRFSDKSELVRALLERERIAPDTVALVGDRAYDIAAARNNKLSSIGVLWGYGSEKELKTAQADHLVKTCSDLRRLLFNPECIPTSSEDRRFWRPRAVRGVETLEGVGVPRDR